jgi:hypothetical protein
MHGQAAAAKERLNFVEELSLLPLYKPPNVSLY